MFDAEGNLMPYIADMNKANNLVAAKHLVGNGQCVTFVHAVVPIPPSSLWHRGERVKDAVHIAPGTIIATFDDDGRYGNHTNGTNHAAVFLRQTPAGIVVLDQWRGNPDQPPHQRTLRFMGGHGKKVNDGDQFYVVQ